jgi:glycosyltransferase involved in cell wall biosynthesis
MENQPPVLGIIIPCYNEQDIISFTAEKLFQDLRQYIASGLIAENSFLGLVDDGSRDRTWEIIKSLAENNRQIRAIRLSTNKGHQAALLAGLTEFGRLAGCLITMDADLQDDAGVIPEMLEKYRQGSEIVFGVRNSRTSDTFFKRSSANGFYRLMNIFGTHLIRDHADFRLTSARVNRELENYKEVNIFLRGIFTTMGFNTSIVYYGRNKRLAGKTKYPLSRMLSLAFEGITSFSTVPLRIITLAGFLIFLVCIILMGYAVWAYFTGRAIAGWFSTVLPFYFLGGVQILCIGILGEYLGRIYKEVKRRPRYIIEEKI